MIRRARLGELDRSPSSRRAWIEIFGHFGPVAAILVSPSSRRAWIEICSTTRHPLPSWSPSSRRAWIEICSSSLRCRCSRSPSSRRAWIEIGHVLAVVNGDWLVALLAEGVDRNTVAFTSPAKFSVALLAEGVDRNRMLMTVSPPVGRVALLAEGVDRNELVARLKRQRKWSPSSRRAWIEMTPLLYHHQGVFCRPPRGGRG